MEWAMNEHHQPFEEIKLINANGAEQWSARQLGKLLGYSEYRHFIPVLTRAKEACENSGHTIDDHFEEILDMVKIGSNAKRALKDIVLSRYACYLVVQNGDPAKPVIAAGQTYFAIQTRRQELADDEAFKQLREDEKRLFLRNELKEHNKQLVEAAQQANTTHFDVGSKVRQTIQELGGTMPEELPTPQVSIKQLENSVKITEKK
ncbi:putative DNA-damage-inducible protein D [Escherichia coli MS 124-1]|jgi:DNA-damage-inducible protein D|nr:putative DNA-damage-inducible protein D [Escherichia coli MS 84-1]EFK68602.1 putative DNA-damage-inducible protein D [Escherichia coli MS 124-1]EFU34000.1 putative DNA-damage-inducible protein D [Escherichia coli MS 85-1]EGX20350.1 DNA-damage-inducible protein D [Escherichia coli TX1999]ESC94431.1 DNA-damage-inducible protein D family protein [Escherichia coli 113302]ESD64610.1 DNA-damage-inducible protein D family protein [Escherichia coli 908555]CAR00613.1 DNA-damage-inducible protein D 